jgi:hypothetical protein
MNPSHPRFADPLAPSAPLVSFAFTCAEPGCAFGQTLKLTMGMTLGEAAGGWARGLSRSIQELLDHAVAHAEGGGCHEVRMVVHQSGEGCEHEH